MSASREKQTRQEKINSGWVDPKAVQAAEQQKKEKRNNKLYGAIAIIFVIAIVAAFVWNSNVIPKNSSAATVDGEKYTAAEVGFYYQNAYLSFVNNNSYFLSYLGLNTNAPLTSQTINETASAMMGIEAGGTWHDYFLEQSLIQIATIQNGLAEAEAEGFVYPEDIQSQVETSLASLAETAKASGISAEQYLQSNFGTYLTEEVYKQELTRLLQYDAYASAYYDSRTYTDAELEEAYNAAPENYDSVSYEVVYVYGTADSTTDAEGKTVEPTEEESAAALEAAKKTADELLAAYRKGESLEALTDGNEDVSYVSNDSMTYSGDVVTEWLFDSARKAGDSTVLESGTTYYVVVFHDRTRGEYNTIDIRHILIQPAAGELKEGDEGYEDEQAQLDADAKAKAEDILAQWKAGEATEDSFAALAMEHSVDGSSSVGGLYTGVYQGQMVPEFNDWCFDSRRKVGDTGIVETTYGYHIMYFSGENMPYWQLLVSENLAYEDYMAWTEALSADSDIQRHDFGMKFVG